MTSDERQDLLDEIWRLRATLEFCQLKPEIKEQLERSEAEIAAGRVHSMEEVFTELDAEFAEPVVTSEPLRRAAGETPAQAPDFAAIAREIYQLVPRTPAQVEQILRERLNAG